MCASLFLECGNDATNRRGRRADDPAPIPLAPCPWPLRAGSSSLWFAGPSSHSKIVSPGSAVLRTNQEREQETNLRKDRVDAYEAFQALFVRCSGPSHLAGQLSEAL